MITFAIVLKWIFYAVVFVVLAATGFRGIHR